MSKSRACKNANVTQSVANNTIYDQDIDSSYDENIDSSYDEDIDSSDTMSVEVKTNTVLPKRKAKTKYDDKLYNPKRQRKNDNWTPEGLIRIRCDTSNEIVNDNGLKEPLRTSFMMNTSSLEVKGVSLSPRKTSTVVSRLINENKPDSYLDIFQVLKTSEYGSPVKALAYSPDSKTVRKMYSDGGDGTTKTFTNKKKLDMGDAFDLLDFLDGSPKFEESDAVKKIEHYLSACKEREVTLSKNNNKKSKLTSKRVSFTKPATKKTMGISAEEYGNEAGMVEEINGISILGVKFEWLHMIADMFAKYLDNKEWAAVNGLQSSDNLIFGTANANTRMLLEESVIRKCLIQRYPQGFTLHAKVHLEQIEIDCDDDQKEYAHMGKWLEYTIATPDFKLHKRFDLLTLQQPFADYLKFLEIEMKTMMELSDNKENTNAPPQPQFLFQQNLQSVNQIVPSVQNQYQGIHTYQSTRARGR